MMDSLVMVLGDPTAVMVTFCVLAAAEVIWTRKAVTAGQELRQGVEAGGGSAQADAWLDRWAQRGPNGRPLYAQGRVQLAAEPPQLRARNISSPFAVAPGLLTALGVLGTFLGIHQGLGSIDFAALASTQELLGAARGLLDGMKTAFATSVAGLQCAAIMMLLLAGTRLMRRSAATKDLQAWRNLTRPAGQGGLGDAAAQMAGAVVSMNDNLTALLGRMETQLDQLAALRSEQGDTLIRQVIRDFRDEALEPLAQRLDQSAAVSERAALAVESLEGSLGGITTKLADSVSMLERFQSQTHRQLQQFTRHMSGTLQQFQSETGGMLEKTGTAIREAVDESIMGMARQREAFEQSADKAAETFRGIRVDLQAALQTQAAEQAAMLDAMKDANLEVIEQSQAAYAQQAEAIQAIGTEAAKTMSDARQALVSGLQETSTIVQDELARFRDAYQQQLSEYLQRQSEALDTVLERQRRGLQAVVERLEQAFEDEFTRRKELAAEIADTISQLKEGAEVLDHLATTLGLHSSERLAQLIELSRQMAGQTTALQDAYRDLSQQHEQSVRDSREQLTGYLNEFNTQHTQVVRRIDDAAARLTDGLYQAADVLVTATTARRSA